MNTRTVSLALIVAGASIVAVAQFAAKPLVAAAPLLPIYFPAVVRLVQPQAAAVLAVPPKPALVVAPSLPEKAKVDESPAVSPAPSLPVPKEQRTEPSQRQRQITVTQPKRPAPQGSRDVVVDFLNR